MKKKEKIFRCIINDSVWYAVLKWNVLYKLDKYKNRNNKNLHIKKWCTKVYDRDENEALQLCFVLLIRDLCINACVSSIMLEIVREVVQNFP